MKALAFRISFFESLFTVHYTKAFKLSYPTLLPITVFGLLGNICGYDRGEIVEKLGNFYFGSTFIKGDPTEENITFIQFKNEGKGKYRSGVVKTQVYSNSEHIIVVAGEENELRRKIIDKIRKIDLDTIKDEYGEWKIIRTIRYPYGGQNDFFAKDIRILDKLLEVEKDNIVRGYVVSSLIKSINKDTNIEILPARYKNRLEYFIFVKKGYVELKEPIDSVLKIPLYKIKDFAIYKNVQIPSL
ncbi:CRISPR-associated protein Cas5 [Nanobdella aerobiophila]|uniref:CRISPR-associated protein Cas5 n=1 Tax=Nanobdella aerobiophila TaxID=2586965 RepID=A0A915WSW6_9ARCH|nr:CRISPR-associated protein Cas5 [Nanobdella aerobiophila]BBL45730.1 CRISPR-associated protein Cas5 [Nanobdella aerobiophila]